MAKSPEIPNERSSFADPGDLPTDEAAECDDARDSLAGVRSKPSVGPVVNSRLYGNLKQNLTTHWKVQER